MTTRFNKNILIAARKVQSPRATADSSSDAGNRYKSSDWANYQNRAIRDILRAQFEALGDAFPQKFPQYIRTSSVLTLVSGTVVKPVESWYFTDLSSSDYKIRYYKLKDSEIEYIKAGRDPIRKPTAQFPMFWEEGNNLVTLPVSNSGVIGRYIVTHQDIVVTTGGASPDPLDLQLNANFDGEIVDKMVAYALADASQSMGD